MNFSSLRIQWDEIDSLTIQIILSIVLGKSDAVNRLSSNSETSPSSIKLQRPLTRMLAQITCIWHTTKLHYIAIKAGMQLDVPYISESDHESR